MPTRPYALAPEKLHFMIELRDQIDKMKCLCYNGDIACIIEASRHVNLGFFLLSVRASVLFLYFYRGETLARADITTGYSHYLAPRVKGRKKVK